MARDTLLSRRGRQDAIAPVIEAAAEFEVDIPPLTGVEVVAESRWNEQPRTISKRRRAKRPEVRAGDAALGVLLAALSLMPHTVSSASARTLDRGWWVVVGTVPAPENNLNPFPTVNPSDSAARRCGMEPYTDFSTKFGGDFAPDFIVTVVGAYPTRSAANAALARLRPCVPGAYIRRGNYAGD